MNLLCFLRKDFSIELRDRSHITSIITLFLLVAVMFTLGAHLAIISHQSLARIFPVFVWIAFVLIQTTTISKSFSSEFELGAIDSLHASQKNLSTFYQSKCIINSSIGIFAFGFFVAFLSFLLPPEVTYNATYSLPALICFVLAIIAYSSLATILIPISMASALKDILLALLLIPLSFPIFFAVLEVSMSAATGIALEWDSAWLSLLALICLLYIPLGSLLFDHTLKQ